MPLDLVSGSHRLPCPAQGLQLETTSAWSNISYKLDLQGRGYLLHSLLFLLIEEPPPPPGPVL